MTKSLRLEHKRSLNFISLLGRNEIIILTQSLIHHDNHGEITVNVGDMIKSLWLNKWTKKVWGYNFKSPLDKDRIYPHKGLNNMKYDHGKFFINVS
jgi:hypothetical protein